jgi:hypothetical protein
MAKKMTKKEAERDFKENILPWLKNRYERDGKKDAIARMEAWSTFTDELCKEGRITSKQYNNWSVPKICDYSRRER